MDFTLSIIIPCYQNEQNIPDLISEMKVLLATLPQGCTPEFVLVEDGSRDRTFELLQTFKSQIFNTKIIKLTGNFGSYNALIAGMNYATGACMVFLHADLQEPPHHIPEMISIWQKGMKLVIGQRVTRQEGLITRATGSFYHSLMKKIALPHIPDGGYDLILFDREICDKIVAMNETNINLVYLISWLRYPFATVPVTRSARVKGKSGWTFLNKLKLFADSIVGFSYLPIRIVSAIAMFFIFLFICASSYAIVLFISGAGFTVAFWLAYIVLACSTAILFCASVIAEYLWRTLEASRRRPPFVVDQVL